jgi:hypothetical protein
LKVIDRDNRRQAARALCAAVEAIERRMLLSFAGRFGADHVYRPPDDASQSVAPGHAYTNYEVYNPSAGTSVSPLGVSAPPSTARTPAQIRKSYGVGNVSFGGVTGDGTGQTIAIIDAFDDPSFVSDTNANYSNSDLVRFDSFFTLPNPPAFKKFNASGQQSSYPSSGVANGWAGEIALDVEWSHAMAPKATIWLVEAASDSFDDLNTAVDWARSQPGVSVVTMSYGGDDFSGESSTDSFFTTPMGHAGVTFFSSSGDTGGVVEYQASSPNVVGVGGTTLNQADSTGTYSSESAWSGSGGGISSNESKPIYQTLVTTPSTIHRTVPDISADANPTTGVAVLDSSPNGIGSSKPWFNGRVGGTSLASPLWAGFMAIVDQGRSLLSTPLPSLDGATQTLLRLYTLSTNDFHDITSGSAGGFSATAGYDRITGRGTPKVDVLAKDLAGGATITGSVFQDNNGNGVLDAGEPTQSGITVYLDYNNNKTLDSFEPSTVTNASGNFTFTDVIGGASISAREVLPANFLTTTSSVSALTSYNTVTGSVNLGDFPKVFNGTSGNDSYTLSLDSTGTMLQINDGTTNFSINKNLVSTLSISAGGGDDLLTIDDTHGSPVPASGLFFDAGTSATPTGDSVALIGGPGADTAIFNANTITFGGTITLTSVHSYSFDGRGGHDSLTVNSGMVLVPAGQVLASLAVGSGAGLDVAPGGNNVIETQTLNDQGTIDLANNGMIVDYSGSSPLASVISLITQGRAVDANGQPTWTGGGITSSVAAANPLTLGIGAIDNASLGAAAYTTFLTHAVDSTAVLVRCTGNGDANLDGITNTADFVALASNFGQTTAGWASGDFNFDGKVNALDFNALATSFGASASASPPAPSAPMPSLFSDSPVSPDTQPDLIQIAT